MQRYYGIKQIKAKPMNRQDYNDLRGWALPSDEDGTDEGYLVEYVDGGAANVDGFDGYVSWSPSEVFDNAYQPTDAMSFSCALEALKDGSRVARNGWNGKMMYICLETPAGHPAIDYPQNYLPFLQIRTVQGFFVPWLASQTDMLADDWYIVEEE